MRILVTGATGRVGSLVARNLSPHHSLTATSRSPEQHEGFPVRLRKADLADPSPWHAILDSMDAAFLFPAFGHTQHFIRAAADTGLSKLVLLSSAALFDREPSFIRAAHSDIEEQALRAGVPTVFVRPTAFMSNDLGWLPSIKSGTGVEIAFPNAAMPVIAEHDIAEVISHCLTNPTDKEVLHLTGDQSLTQTERVQILAQAATGAPAHIKDITHRATESGLPGMPGPPGQYLLRNLKDANESAVRPTSDVQHLLRRNPMTYSQWANLTLRVSQKGPGTKMPPARHAGS